MYIESGCFLCWLTIQNNITLKQLNDRFHKFNSWLTIQNNITLKLEIKM